MPADSSADPASARPDRAWYDYAIIRVVPRVERGEFLNAGIIVFARSLRFLETRIELDEAKLQALAPDIDLKRLRGHLDAFEAISAARSDGGPIATQTQSERFHWLTAPRSTVIQTSPIHVGRCTDPTAALEDLMQRFVRKTS